MHAQDFKWEKPPTSVQDNGQLHCVLQGATFLFKTQRAELSQRGALRASGGFLLEQAQPPSIRDKAPPLCPHSSLKETEFRSCLLLLLLAPLFISLILTEWPRNSLSLSLSFLSHTRSMPFSYTPTTTNIRHILPLAHQTLMIHFSVGREIRQLSEHSLQHAGCALHLIATHQPMLIIFDPTVMPLLSVFMYDYV